MTRDGWRGDVSKIFHNFESFREKLFLTETSVIIVTTAPTIFLLEESILTT